MWLSKKEVGAERNTTIHPHTPRSTYYNIYLIPLTHNKNTVLTHYICFPPIINKKPFLLTQKNARYQRKKRDILLLLPVTMKPID
jgi:hypothetical protein